MSATLKAIMEHWDGELPGGEGQSVLPFNLEVFCRKNDALVDDLTEQLANMTIERNGHKANAREAVIARDNLTKQLAERDEIIKAVAHIGIDFGYGKYELEEKFIDMARAALPAQEPTT